MKSRRSSPTTVFVDAMGGDLAPKVNVRGAFAATTEHDDIRIVLVADEAKLRPLLDSEAKNEKTARPTIAVPLPATTGFLLLLDAGANTACKPIHLIQKALKKLKRRSAAPSRKR